jgi:hypothetical protein
MWKVMKASSNSASHRTISRHRLKRRAEMKARQKARSGDELTILTSDGAIQSRVTVR